MTPLAPVRLWLDPSDWEDLVTQASHHASVETGGVLLGWRNGHDVVVTNVVGPGPGALHARNSFHPDSDWQVSKVAELYEQSGRSIEYLGDWHTHPGGRPWPSRRDERTLRHIARSAEARCPDPIMVILGSVEPDAALRWRAGVFVLGVRARCLLWQPRASVARLSLIPR